MKDLDLAPSLLEQGSERVDDTPLVWCPRELNIHILIHSHSFCLCLLTVFRGIRLTFIVSSPSSSAPCRPLPGN